MFDIIDLTFKDIAEIKELCDIFDDEKMKVMKKIGKIL